MTAESVEPPSKQFWLVRHGETEWSLSGRHTSFTDLQLTDSGRDRAKAVAPLLADIDFAVVISSPLRRATETANLAGFAQPEIDENLLEWNYGSYEGVTTHKIREKVPGWSIWSHGPPGDGDGETHGQVAVRADQIVSRVRAASGPVLAFGHGHMMRVITARWLGLDSRDGRLFVLDAGAVSVLGSEHEWPAIRAWNQKPL